MERCSIQSILWSISAKLLSRHSNTKSYAHILNTIPLLLRTFYKTRSRQESHNIHIQPADEAQLTTHQLTVSIREEELYLPANRKPTYIPSFSKRMHHPQPRTPSGEPRHLHQVCGRHQLWRPDRPGPYHDRPRSAVTCAVHNFNIHRRVRPDRVGGLLYLHELAKRDSNSFSVPGSDFGSEVDSIWNAFNNIFPQVNRCHNDQNTKFHDSRGDRDSEAILLLPVAFPERSPMHPTYGADHGTVAGACVTVYS